MTAASAGPASPCIGVCRLEPDRGWCVGCGRSGEEIGSWRDASAAAQEAVIADLPDRLAALDRVPETMDLDAAEIHALLHTRLEQGRGALVLGCHGALAEFMAAPGERPRVTVTHDTITAETTGGRLSVALREDVRAFAGGGSARRGPMILAVADEPPPWPVASGLTPAGDDGASGRLFDLGLGHCHVRFLVNTSDRALASRLEAMAGTPVEALLQTAGAHLVEASPARVVETPLARCEVTTPIPPPGGATPAGPHTHLMAGPLALGRLLPPGMARPTGMIPAALYYPPAV